MILFVWVFRIAIDIYSASKPATTGKGKTKTCSRSNANPISKA